MRSDRTPWDQAHAVPSFPSLDGDLAVDVAVVGAGITGLTTAFLLGRAGLKVALLEARRVARGDSGFTTAHVTAVLDTRYHQLASDFGESGAKLAAASHQGAIDQIAELVRDLGIGCDFERVPAYVYTERRSGRAELAREHEAASRAGLSCALVDETPLPFPVAAALRFDEQAQFHPLRYFGALADAIVKQGGQILEETRMTDVSDGQPAKVTTERGVVTARAVVMATHTASNNRFFLITKIVPQRTYAMTVAAPDFPRGLFFDTEDPYHYIRRHPFAGGDRVIVGGADHGVGKEQDTNQSFARLESWSRGHLGPQAPDHTWSGQVFESVDGLPFIGRNSFSKHVFVATGFGGHGMTSGTLAAMMISDQILGRKDEREKLFDATRIKPLAAAKEYAKFNAGFPAHLVADRLKRSGGASPESVQVGEGRVVDVKGRKLAVYRDDNGLLSVLSATCTHFGCIVRWNETERSWDCPCHGGRFDVNGEVLEGPPRQPLAKVEAMEAESSPQRKGA